MAVDQLDAIAERLRNDTPFYAQNCLKIVGPGSRLIPLTAKPAQLRIDAALEEQRQAGKPLRLIVPKARKEGVSTWSIAKTIQRVTQRENHNAICVAHNGATAGELMNMATVMYSHLPADDEWTWLKPPIANKARRKELVFGQPSRVAQNTGDLGINSRLVVDSASEFEAGRGFTFHTFIGSEVAFWSDIKRKLTAMLNAVPDDPETLVILESTSQGYNHWRTLCLDARDGRSDFAMVFLPWYEEPQYRRPFLSEEERGEFIDSIGEGPYGEDEQHLLDEHGVDYEQLNWRRHAIANRCQGDLRIFHVEYPTTLEESFLSTSRVVFAHTHIEAVRKRAEALEKPERGGLDKQQVRVRRLKWGLVEVPEKPLWTPDRKGHWTVWEHPNPDSSYVIGVDPAGDDVSDEHERAMHAIQVINHRTREQAAEFQWQGDPDLLGQQVYLAALWFNKAWIGIETTGGWGLSIARRIFRDYGYPFMYKRNSIDASKERTEDRLGWDTNRSSKVILEDGMREMLREGTHGIKSVRLADELTTYVRNEKGKTGPSPGERSDLLMAYMIAQQIAQESPLRSNRPDGGVVSTTTRGVMYPKMGY